MNSYVLQRSVRELARIGANARSYTFVALSHESGIDRGELGAMLAHAVNERGRRLMFRRSKRSKLISVFKRRVPRRRRRRA